MRSGRADRDRAIHALEIELEGIDSVSCGGESLDEMVHEAASRQASATNNEGIREQLDYLLDNGFTLDEIRQATGTVEEDESVWPFQGTPVGHDTDPEILAERREDALADAIEDVLISEDDAGCTDDMTVVSKAAIVRLRKIVLDES